MSATAATTRQIAALIIATAALGAGAAVAAEASTSAPATHAVAMYKEDPFACRQVTDGLMHIDSSYESGVVCP